MAGNKTPYYFPSRDADVVPWTKNFVTVLGANAARWGITEALVSALGALGMAYETAYTNRRLPDAGKVSTEHKNQAREALKKAVRDMVNGHIRYNHEVTPEDWVALGLNPPDTSRGPAPEMKTTVILRLAPGIVRQVMVYFSDSATPDKRGKPYGARNMELACAVLPAPPVDDDQLTRRVTATKPPLALTFREEDRGKTVYMRGRWIGTNNKEGPWSETFSAIVP